jgi:hypothetical protein
MLATSWPWGERAAKRLSNRRAHTEIIINIRESTEFKFWAGKIGVSKY